MVIWRQSFKILIHKTVAVPMLMIFNSPSLRRSCQYLYNFAHGALIFSDRDLQNVCSMSVRTILINT